MLGALNIVIVEDNSADCELALHSLKKFGLCNSITLCREGEQALRLVLRQGEYSNRRNIGLVLLDVHLPKISGLDVLATIRANPETSKVPVIVLTSSSHEPVIAKARGLGADDYMVKPIDFVKVVEAAKALRLRWALLPSIAQPTASEA